MIIQFKEQQVLNYIVPAFTLSAGEIIIIKLPNGPLFSDTIKAINNILVSSKHTPSVIGAKPLLYAEHLKLNPFYEKIIPASLGKWFSKNSNSHNPVFKKIYLEIEWLTPETKINTINGTVRRLISIYSTLSWTNNIILDLMGVDPTGGLQIYETIKEFAKQGGSFLLYDYCDDFKDDCTLFIEAVPVTGIN